MSATDGLEDLRCKVNELLGREGRDRAVSDEDSLFLSGLLDSLKIIELVVYLEKTYGLSWVDFGGDIRSVDSIARIHAMITERSRR